MKVLRTRSDLAFLEELRMRGRLVLVPTMGALHDGHLSLVREGAKLGPVVVTIFVNPAQFGPGEDFESYPRTLERDLELLRDLPVAAVFAPKTDTVYSGGEEVTVQPGRRGRGLCGGDRPGHFAGVLTVVAKLFGLIRPDVAVFGRKDAQQCLVIDQMVADLCMSVQLVDIPTCREDDGLAMSSRNRYLSARDRERALCLSSALRKGRALVAEGRHRREAIVSAMREELRDTDGIEYAEVRNVPDLETQGPLTGRVLLAVAARVGAARLIDNFVLQVEEGAAGVTVTDSCLLGTGDIS